jgi:flagellar motor protein MotB
MMAWTPPPASIPTMQAIAPPPIPVVPIASSYSYGGGNDLVSEAYSQGIAATSPTILTAPTGSEFAAPNAQALSADLSGIVPRVVLESYNQSLSQSAPGGGVSAQAIAAGGYGVNAVASGIEYLDPVVIKFKRGSSRLSSRDKRRIGKVVTDYRSQGGTIYVIGHASSRTGDMKKSQHDLVNFDISIDRANAVTGELLNQGVAAEHLKMEALADRDPIYYEYMPLGEAGNQRVEIFRE